MSIYPCLMNMLLSQCRIINGGAAPCVLAQAKTVTDAVIDYRLRCRFTVVCSTYTWHVKNVEFKLIG